MAKTANIRPLIFPLTLGFVLGIIAKLVDIPYITSELPVFDDIMGRFGIWVWAAALISIRSKNALLAAARSFLFFAGMLTAYYSYTVIFLNFFPKSQIILWSGIGMVTPLCGFLIWQVHRDSGYTNFISSIPFILFFTEWYLTAFAAWNWNAKDKLLLLTAYICFSISLLAVIPTNRKRLFSLIYGVLLSIVLTGLIQAAVIVNPYELLLNV
ncbi:MAG: hypothetical protein K2K90_09690 [Lachnospiraceae bacterium]|nr:hypothetical protein [Lachnospiraceae bacterium]